MNRAERRAEKRAIETRNEEVTAQVVSELLKKGKIGSSWTSPDGWTWTIDIPPTLDVCSKCGEKIVKWADGCTDHVGY
jgi:hypothetical protein